MNQEPDADDSLVISYLLLRKAIGCLGVALPFVLAFGGMLVFSRGLQRSISDYYYTGMRDVFVGILCSIAVFLISYKGYERKDAIAGDLACLFAVGVALFPTAPGMDASSSDKIIGRLHLLFATSFFLTIAYFSLFLFTKTDPTKPPTRQKLQRNVVYKVCGSVILIAIALIVVVVWIPEGAAGAVRALNPVFWLESIAVVAFGVSWLTKGEAILKDQS
jgi:hypothetical protein